MEGKFIEIISDSELEKLREAVRLAERLVELQKEQQSLYNFKFECDKADFKIDKMKREDWLRIREIKIEEKFTYPVPNFLYILLTAIENGDLIWKDAKV